MFSNNNNNGFGWAASSNISQSNGHNQVSLNQYLSRIASELQTCSGKSLALLLSFRQLSKEQILSKISEKQLSAACISCLSQYKPWNAIIWHHLQSLAHSLSNQPLAAWKSA